MADLVYGLGQIGKPLHDLLANRNILVDGYDKDPSKNITSELRPHYDMIHVCIRFDKNNPQEFINAVVQLVPMADYIVIHSTVKTGTTQKIQEIADEQYDVPIIYSPVRGVHHNMYYHLNKFQKYYAYKERVNEFEKRFPNCLRHPNTTSLEYTKILVDTTYLGWLVLYRKICDKIYPDLYWDFANEINYRYNNRPVMYNTEEKIGGHCVIPNLDLIDHDMMKIFQKMIGELGQQNEQE